MNTKSKILDLPLKKEWYNMIESGEKKEEYREIHNGGTGSPKNIGAQLFVISK